MIVKNGTFRNDNNELVEFFIDEDVVDGQYKIFFKQMDKILSYSKRETSQKVEIFERKKEVEPIKPRTLEQYVDFINEFYKSQKGKNISEQVPVVRCDIEKIEGKYTSESLKTSEEGKKYIERQAKIRGISFENMIEIIDNNKKSGYSR